MTNYEFERALKKLGKKFQDHIKLDLKRHDYYLTKGERGRLKHRRAVKRQNKMCAVASNGHKSILVCVQT